MEPSRRHAALLAASLTCLCAHLAPQEPGARPLPALADASLIWDSTAGEAVTLDQLVDRLAKADAVFLGETHLDDTTHRMEAAILTALLKKTGGKVVLSLEMFERDVQPVLDSYLHGRIDESEFLATARPWGNYRTGYRALIETAKKAGIPVIAANTPMFLRRRLAMGGKAALEALPPDQRALLPEQIFPASEAYWKRVDRAVRGHMGFTPSSQPTEARLYEGQNLWDNCMGDACAKIHAAHPDHVVLHVAGGFHVAYRDGTVAQFLRRAAGAKAAVVSIVPAPAAHAARPERDAAQGDYLVYAGAFARGLDEGTHAVALPTELRYSIDLPDTASDSAPAPLLIWLHDGSWRNTDARALWTAALGDEAAVVVVHPPYPERQRDLALGGRWAQIDGFRADYSRLAHGLERIVEYVTRHFPVDQERILIAGQGAGATTVLWTAMYTEWLPVRFLAVDPAGIAKLRMEGLPDHGPVTRALRIAVPAGEVAAAETLAKDYRDVEVRTEVVALDGAAGPEFGAVESEVRRDLGLPAKARPGEPTFLVIEDDLPRARQWAQMYARKLEQQGTPCQVVTAARLPEGIPTGRVRRLNVLGAAPRKADSRPPWSVTDFSDGSGLPLAGGPFGGTTIVVLPADASDADRKAWQDLAESRAIKRRSFFANLSIATEDGKPGLAQVLTELRGRGRSRMLIVPATFCAGPETMRRLAEQAGGDLDGLDLFWLPGLGGELCNR